MDVDTIMMRVLLLDDGDKSVDGVEKWFRVIKILV